MKLSETLGSLAQARLGPALLCRMKLFLLTQNVGRVFEDPGVLTAWARQLRGWADAVGADFVALHFQELGGKDWKKGGLKQVPAFSEAIARAFDKGA